MPERKNAASAPLEKAAEKKPGGRRDRPETRRGPRPSSRRGASRSRRRSDHLAAVVREAAAWKSSRLCHWLGRSRLVVEAMFLDQPVQAAARNAQQLRGVHLVALRLLQRGVHRAALDGAEIERLGRRQSSGAERRLQRFG